MGRVPVPFCSSAVPARPLWILAPGAPARLKELENPLPVIEGETVATVTLSKSALEPPEYSPKPVAEARAPVNVAETLHDPPRPLVHPQAWLPLIVKLSVYHELNQIVQEFSALQPTASSGRVSLAPTVVV